MDVKRSDFVFELDERFHLDPGSPIPLYHQVQQIIQDRITHENMVDRRLPAESELMTIFGVSRATVKKTLDNLVRQGLLERRRGLGSKVIQEPLTEDLGRLKSYTEEMRSHGVQTRSKVISVGMIEPPPFVQERLKLADGEPALRIERLRGTGDMFPVVLHETYFPGSLGVDLTEDFSGSLYALLEERYHVAVAYADEILSASKATADEARHLELRPGDSVLLIERVSYNAQHRPVEYVHALYRPDRYKFSIRLRR